jgi:hypothetical protein
VQLGLAARTHRLFDDGLRVRFRGLGDRAVEHGPSGEPRRVGFQGEEPTARGEAASVVSLATVERRLGDDGLAVDPVAALGHPGLDIAEHAEV